MTEILIGLLLALSVVLLLAGIIIAILGHPFWGIAVVVSGIGCVWLTERI